MSGQASALRRSTDRRRTNLAWLDARTLLVLLLFVALFAIVAARSQPADTDTFWHLKSGELMWQTGRVLRADPFSHTVEGQAWIDHGWLVQVALWPIYRAAGLPGLALLLAALVTLAFVLVYRQGASRPGDVVAAFVTLLAALASSVAWSVRPQIVTFLLAAVIAYLLAAYKRTGRARRLWPIPLLVLLWVNCHGGFVVAFILMACYLAGEIMNGLTRSKEQRQPGRPGPIALAMAASLPMVLLNPNTVRLVPYAYQTVNIGPLQTFIQEWAAPDFHLLQLQPFIWLLLLALAALALARRQGDWTDLALIGVFGYMGLLAVRNVALFALVAAPVVARYATAALDELALSPRLSWLSTLTRPLPRRPSRAISLLNLGLLVVALAAGGALVGLRLVQMDEPDGWGPGLPVQAAEYLQTHDLPGKMFNTYNWGGYFVWTLYPQQPVFVDGRTDLYAFHGVLDDYVQVHLARAGWRDVLARYGIGYVVTEEGGLLATVMDEAEDWQAVYRDGITVIYVPAAAAGQAPGPASSPKGRIDPGHMQSRSTP